MIPQRHQVASTLGSEPIEHTCIPTALYRSQDGMVLHHRSCPNLGVTAVPWVWAEHLMPYEVQAAMGRTGIRECRRCKPLEVMTEQRANAVEFLFSEGRLALIIPNGRTS